MTCTIVLVCSFVVAVVHRRRTTPSPPPVNGPRGGRLRHSLPAPAARGACRRRADGARRWLIAASTATVTPVLVAPRGRGTRGQATTEYALILLAAALVGLMVVAWATAGGGAARVSRLFNAVIDAAIQRV